MANRLLELPSYLRKTNGNGLCCVIANFCKVKEIRDYYGDRQIYSEENDVEMINNFFQTKLGYKCLPPYLNNTKSKFWKALHDIKQMLDQKEYENIDRLFLFVLSHGSEEGVTMCTEDGFKDEYDDNDKLQAVPVDEIISFFDHSNISSLKGYPKCIFIQSCRGKRLTNIAASVDHSYIYNSTFKQPSTHFDQTRIEQDEQLEQPPNDEEILEIIPREVLTPSSENMFTFFSCSKGERSYVENKKSKFIYNVINTFEEYFESSHLQDMVVEVTNRLAKECVTGFPFSLIFKHDSSYQATFEAESGSDIDFTIYAKDLEQGTVGKVVKFPKHDGMVLNDSYNIDSADESLVLECKVQYKPTGQLMPVKATVKKINQDFLSNGDFEIDNTSNSLLFSGSRTVAYGTVEVQGNRVVKVQNQVQLNLTGAHYEVTFNVEGRTKRKSAAYIVKKNCKIWHLRGKNDRKLVAAGKGVIGTHCIPNLRIEMYQLPVYESSFTKKMFLSSPPENASKSSSKFYENNPMVEDPCRRFGLTMADELEEIRKENEQRYTAAKREIQQVLVKHQTQPATLPTTPSTTQPTLPSTSPKKKWYSFNFKHRKK